MILKERDPGIPDNKLERAGAKAEEQMAFYLRRAFGKSEDVFVFNDLRLVDGDDVAQIDHLVMHRYGFFIIESKSVSTDVEINEHEEWSRRWNGRLEGMASPVQQARRQAEFLREFLNKNCEKLRDKYIQLTGRIQGGFKYCPLDVCVAISDHGRVHRRGVNPPEVMKADQVCDHIQRQIERHRKGASLFHLPDGDYGMWGFKPVEQERTRDFLLQWHSPRNTVRQSPASATPKTRSTSTSSAQTKTKSGPRKHGYVCRHCGADDLLASHSRYGYYLRCKSCEKGTPFHCECPACAATGRIRKRGLQYRLVCESCHSEEVVWTNSPA